jgi:diadenosine tetraphosphate (Ap4A) HIT family hydrolase
VRRNLNTGIYPTSYFVSYIRCLPDCPYCSASAEDAWITNEHAVAIPAPNPAASCHVIVAPRRHVPAFYDLDVQEQRVIWEMLRELRMRITQSLAVTGFDAGFVDIPPGVEPAHTHVHLLPRTTGETVVRPDGAEWVDLSSQ